MFSKNIRVVYLYMVCFITLMMVIGGVIATANAAANYLLQVNTWQTDVQRIRNIINSVAVWAIAAPVFAFHWRAIIKLERLEEAGEDGNIGVD